MTVEEVYKQEISYRDDVIAEQGRIIHQLMFGVGLGEPTYIHPYDVVELLDSLEPKSIVETYIGDTQQLILDGISYKQTTLIPARTKAIV